MPPARCFLSSTPPPDVPRNPQNVVNSQSMHLWRGRFTSQVTVALSMLVVSPSASHTLVSFPNEDTSVSRNASGAEESWACSLLHAAQKMHISAVLAVLGASEHEGGAAFLLKLRKSKRLPIQGCAPAMAESRLTISCHLSWHLTVYRMSVPLQGCPPFSLASLRYS